jgi:hemerythrin superfamily protein
MANPIEQVQAKTAGAARAVKAGFNGLRGVFLHLAEEHGEVGSLMKRVAKSTDPEVRREHYPQIRAELLAHERAELAVVYSVLSQNFQTRGLAMAHQREAEELEAAIAAVDALDFASPQWGIAFERVFSLVQRHVEEEEIDFFPRAQRAIGEAQAQAMLESYEAAKKQAK